MRSKTELDQGLRDVLKLIEKGKPAQDADAEALMAALQEKKTTNVDVVDAYELYMRIYKREVVESLLLCECTDREIEEVTLVPKHVIEVFRRFFFNPEVFKDRLDRIDYAENYAGSEWGKKLKKMAVELGKDPVRIKVSGGHCRVSAESAMNSIRTMAYVLAQAALANPIDSAISREAYRWAQLCLRSADEKDANTSDTVENFIITLKTAKTTTNAKETGINPEDILK
jgi:hypothetical protein